MNTTTRKAVAEFKIRPTSIMPHRPGPVECVRNCPNCCRPKDENNLVEDEDIIRLKSRNNLLLHKKIWFCPYRSVQYHPGQIDVLKKSLLQQESAPVIYVIAITSLDDLYYFQQVLSLSHLPNPEIVSKEDDPIDRIQNNKIPSLIPILLKSCPTKQAISCDDQLKELLFTVRELRDFLSPIVEEVDKEFDFDVAIVPVSISKDHDKTLAFKSGSMCIQVLEPYFLNSYLSMLNTKFPTGHLIQHLYHDLAKNIALLPTHIVAFLVLYLDRKEGVSRSDLANYISWFRKYSMDMNLHLAFSGDLDNIIQFAVTLLGDAIYMSREGLYIARDIEQLVEYANPLMPNIIYHGLIARAILMAYNKSPDNELQLKFCQETHIRVLLDDVQEIFLDLAERVETSIPCRRPCERIMDSVSRAIDYIRTFSRHYKIEEPQIKPMPRIGFGLDFEEDEQYFESKKDNPAFKSWISMTKRDYRLDQLNLLLNATVAYFDLMMIKL